MGSGHHIRWAAVVIFVGAAGLSPAIVRAQDGITADILQDVKAATVFIMVDAGKFKGSGSGFLVKSVGDAGWIVTNRHVVAPEGTNPSRTAFGVVFRSGTPKEQMLKAELVALDPQRDLAVLKVGGVKEMPKPIDLTKKVQLIETMSVLILGYPFGAALATGKGAPAVTVNKGSVSSVRMDDRGEPAMVQIDGNINPGNSGGPVVDAKGRLAGVSVATIKGAGIGIAIPPTEVAKMLNGRVIAAGLTPKGVEKGVAELDVDVRLIDPLAKIKTVTVLYVRTDSLKDAIKPAKDGTWPRLPNARSVLLNVADQRATGQLKISAGADKAAPPLTVQFQYTGGDGKVTYSEANDLKIEK